MKVDLARLLGVPPSPLAEAAMPAAEARLHLVGLIRSRAGSGEGLALIAVDDSLPKVFHVGAVVEGERVLQAVEARSVRVGPRDGSPGLVLNLAPRPGDDVDAQPEPASSRRPAPAVAEAPLTAQQLFQQRQQAQFEEEEAQNRPR